MNAVTETVTFVVITKPWQIEISAELAKGTSREDANAIAALFPKSLKVRGTTCGILGSSEQVGLVVMTVNTEANKTTGEKNEGGMKRYESFLKHAARLGFVVA